MKAKLDLEKVPVSYRHLTVGGVVAVAIILLPTIGEYTPWGNMLAGILLSFLLILFRMWSKHMAATEPYPQYAWKAIIGVWLFSMVNLTGSYAGVDGFILTFGIMWTIILYFALMAKSDLNSNDFILQTFAWLIGMGSIQWCMPMDTHLSLPFLVYMAMVAYCFTSIDNRRYGVQPRSLVSIMVAYALCEIAIMVSYLSEPYIGATGEQVSISAHNFSHFTGMTVVGIMWLSTYLHYRTGGQPKE